MTKARHGGATCVDILGLGKQSGIERLEAARDRGLAIGAHTYGSIQSILNTGLDRRGSDTGRLGQLALDPDTAGPAHAPESAGPAHANVRGPGDYH